MSCRRSEYLITALLGPADLPKDALIYYVCEVNALMMTELGSLQGNPDRPVREIAP